MVRSSLARSTGIFGAITAVTIGCGWKTDGIDRLNQLYPPPPAVDAGGTGTIDIGTPDCAGVTGNWAVELVQKGTIAPLGTPWQITITDLFIASASTVNSMDMTFCNENVAIETSPGVTTTLGQTKIPQPLIDVLAASPIVIPLPGDGSFQASNIDWIWGLQNLTNPLTDPLPTTASDPHVWDEDMDGNPGVTITILSPLGNQYIVRRAIWNFAASTPALADEWLTATLTPTINTVVLGASNSLLNTSPQFMPVNGSTYVMRCVGATYTCGSLSTEYTAVFQQAP